jgi:hypothetical protein|tara:strand:- start:1366 stop:1686 length:321 start_codon:yes stop_codon:yes gene_type:complete
MAINATNFPYDITGVATNTTNILQFVQKVNNLTGQTFMLGMLLAGFIILFVSMQRAGKRDALLTSSFIIAVMSIFFRALEFVSTAHTIVIMIIFVVIFAISTQTRD